MGSIVDGVDGYAGWWIRCGRRRGCVWWIPPAPLNLQSPSSHTLFGYKLCRILRLAIAVRAMVDAGRVNGWMDGKVAVLWCAT